jgi:hypothetical protein
MDEAENHSIPKKNFCGPRKLNIILTQLRNSASLLNFDLFRVGKQFWQLKLFQFL